MSGRNSSLYCTLNTLIAVQVNQNRGKRHDEPGYNASVVVVLGLGSGECQHTMLLAIRRIYQLLRYMVLPSKGRIMEL